MTQQSLSNRQARRIALKAQGFLPQKRGLKRHDKRHLDQLFSDISVLQIDSVNVIDRAHYLTLFARLGAYDRKFVDKLTHDVIRSSKDENRKRYFEYWGHEASVMPVELYPAMQWRMKRAAEGQGVWGGIARFARNKPDVVEAVYREVEQQGPCAVGQLEKRGDRSGPWWGWNDTKVALEFLFWSGRLALAGREKFTRIYDLPERVLPVDILDSRPLDEASAHRQLIELGARSHGVGCEKCLRDYFRLGTKEARRAIDELVEEGTLQPVEVEGWKAQAYLHRDAALPSRASCQALLAPFDSLIWERSRAEVLFDFHYRIEIYVPKEKRKFGYYVLPFLMGDRIVARLDLKANRQEGILEVFAAHGEPRIDRGKVCRALADELELMSGWLGLNAIRVHDGGDLCTDLKQAIPS